MESLPCFLSANASPFVGSGAANLAAEGASSSKDREIASLEKLILDLSNHDLRLNALRELSKVVNLKKELYQHLAPLLWHSFGTIAILIQEIITVYPDLSPPNLTLAKSLRVCHSMSLLQCVASQPATRVLFLNAQMPLYVHPFLNTTTKSKPFEFLRIASLGVIGALVKVADTETVTFMISTETVPLCLRSVEVGLLIVGKILLDDVGLNYICTNMERFYALVDVLANLITSPVERPSAQLLKHIIHCYLRLSYHPSACAAFTKCLPNSLSDGTFKYTLREDPMTRHWLHLLLHNVSRVPAACRIGI